MKIRATLALLAVSFTTGLIAAHPAHAVDIQKMMKNYVDKNLLKKASPVQQQTQNNINIKQAQLDNEIKQGVASGKLTTAEETELRGEFNNIAQTEAGFLSDNVLNDPETVQLVKELEALENKIKAYVGNTSKTSPTQASTTTATQTPPAAVSTTPSVTSASTSGLTLQQRIANGLASGKINRTEADNLFKIETRAHSLESQLRGMSGRSFDKQRAMFKELEQLTQAINSKLGN